MTNDKTNVFEHRVLIKANTKSDALIIIRIRMPKCQTINTHNYTALTRAHVCLHRTKFAH